MSTSAHLANWPKFLLMLVVLLGLFSAWMIGRATWSDVEPIVIAITFYAIGNGVAAVRQEPQQPIFAPSRRRGDPNTDAPA